MNSTKTKRHFLRIAAAVLLTTSFLPGQTHPAKSVLGTVTGFKVDDHTSAVLIQADHGGATSIPFGADTEVVRVAPGQHDLTNGEPTRITEIAGGDRVLVSFVNGMPEARRIVLITATDIARRNEAYRQEWLANGVSGVVASKNGNEVALRSAAQNVTVKVDDHTIVRRYAPDSVRFTDAMFSNVSQIEPGDQLQARGEKSADGSTLKAKEVVFGTFLTKAGTVTAIDAAEDRITIQEMATKQPLLIRVTADSRIKVVPDMQTIMSHMHGGGSPGAREGAEAHGPMGPGGRGMAQMIEMLPSAKIEDLKPGETVVVTSTKGNTGDALTAILLLANADFVAQMMQAAAHPGQQGPDGMNMDEVLRRHGVVPGGAMTLPAILP